MLQQGSLEISEMEQGILPLPHWMCTAWSPTCPWGLPCWKERDHVLSEGGKAVPWKFLGSLQRSCCPRIEFLAQWGAAAFCSCFLALSGLLGSWNKEPGPAFADWKVSFLGKRAGNAAWGGKTSNKAASLPFWLRVGCDVKVELSLPKDYGNVFSFLFLRDGGLVYMLFC